jgi:hypothetical protein
MCLNEDIRQTRVKNSSSHLQEFSVDLIENIDIFFLFERASKTAAASGALFLKFLSFKRRKELTSSTTRKILKKL